jgi:cyclophilin family peptidyl-prolyl cis-trans isomerase
MMSTEYKQHRQSMWTTALALGAATLGLAGLLTACAPAASPTPANKPAPTFTVAGNTPTPKVEAFDPTKSYVATIQTDKGNIVIEFASNKAPKTVENFVKLSRQGFYDGLKFHRVEPNFVVQGGDPKGNGTGGPGYDQPAEISDLKHLTGTVAMARLGDNANPQKRSSGSQFYICLKPAPFLDNEYTIIGQVTQGMDVVQKIAVGDVMRKVTISVK